MKAAVVTFPGSNCDRDLAVAFEQAGAEVVRVWHKDTALPAGVDIVGIPGGFSFGDYLRCGAIAARSPIGQAVADHAVRGGFVLGICNGFQVLTEMGLLPGALMRNAGLKFVCKAVPLTVATGVNVRAASIPFQPGGGTPIRRLVGVMAVPADNPARDDLVFFGYVPSVQ